MVTGAENYHIPQLVTSICLPCCEVVAILKYKHACLPNPESFQVQVACKSSLNQKAINCLREALEAALLNQQHY